MATRDKAEALREALLDYLALDPRDVIVDIAPNGRTFRVAITTGSGDPVVRFEQRPVESGLDRPRGGLAIITAEGRPEERWRLTIPCDPKERPNRR